MCKILSILRRTVCSKQAKFHQERINDFLFSLSWYSMISKLVEYPLTIWIGESFMKYNNMTFSRKWFLVVELCIIYHYQSDGTIFSCLYQRHKLKQYVYTPNPSNVWSSTFWVDAYEEILNRVWEVENLWKPTTAHQYKKTIKKS